MGSCALRSHPRNEVDHGRMPGLRLDPRADRGALPSLIRGSARDMPHVGRRRGGDGHPILRRGAAQHGGLPSRRQRLPLRLPHRPHKRALRRRGSRSLARGHDEVPDEQGHIGCEKVEELGRSTAGNVVRDEVVLPVHTRQTALSY